MGGVRWVVITVGRGGLCALVQDKDGLKLGMREAKQNAARHYDTPGSQGISHPVLMGLNGD